MYLASQIPLIEVFLIESLKITIKVDAIKRQIPCPISPYITPNKKGNETQPNNEGLTSL